MTGSIAGRAPFGTVRDREAMMAGWFGLLKRAAVSGSIASVTSAAALAATAEIEGDAPLRPMNATSHWLHGSGAAAVERADASHTLVGYATHHAATLFWAAIFEGWRDARPPAGPFRLVRDATAMSVIAAGVDYIATPKRFTPGWEYVLSRRSMAWTYAAMAAGLALGAVANDRLALRDAR